MTKKQARQDLKKLIKPGTTVYVCQHHVSASGMLRIVDLYIIRHKKLMRITHKVCQATDMPYNTRHGGLDCGGIGMNMHFETVYALGTALFPQGLVPAKCGRNSGRNGNDPNERDVDGGYALRHETL